MVKKNNFSKNDAIAEIKKWTPPRLHLSKESYVDFMAYDPLSGKMKRKKIMVGRIKGRRVQREYADGIIQRLTDKLLGGWNPWMDSNKTAEYTKFDVVCQDYKTYVARLAKEGSLREESFVSYCSYMKIFEEWTAKSVKYVFQLDKQLISKFLDYVFIDRGNSIQTRNNYLAWLRTFCSWLLQRGFVNENPTAGLVLVNKRNRDKNRTTIDDNDLKRVHSYLESNNKHFLLACYFLHYLFVRPREMSFLRVGDISAKSSSLTLHGNSTKNRKGAVLTVPKKVMALMIELRVLSEPSSYYLFSNDFKPGEERCSEKQFRDYWNRHVRKDLGLPAELKFYSLKDTGITNMLKSNMDVLSVRDQARHSSISITDMYTPTNVNKVNKAILDYEDEL